MDWRLAESVNRRRGVFIFGLLTLYGLACGGCTQTANRTCNVWPFYSEEDLWLKVDGKQEWPEAISQRRVLYPFGEFLDMGDRTVLIVKPLINVEKAKDGHWLQWQFLWPFFFYRRDDSIEKKEFWLFPLICNRRERATNGRVEKDFMLFPLIFSGSGANEGDYFLFFPIYGKGKNFLTFDEFKVIIWPLYWEKRRKGAVRRDFPWPILSRTKGAGYDSWRVWPLWVKKERKGRYKRKWLLWPFFTWGTERLNAKYPVKIFGFFPLYRKAETEIAVDRRYLSILFRQRKDKRTGLSEWDFLWPIFRSEIDPETQERRFRVWPIHGRVKRPKQDSRLVIFPFGWHEKDKRVRRAKRTTTMVIPLWFSGVWKGEDGSEWSYKRLFPLFGYAREKKGGWRLGVLSLPHFDKPIPQGFERNYSVLGLFQTAKRPDAARTTRFMGTLYRHDREALPYDFEIAHIFRRWREKEGRSGWSALFGLIQRERTDNISHWRIFYIPLTRRAKGPAPQPEKAVAPVAKETRPETEPEPPSERPVKPEKAAPPPAEDKAPRTQAPKADGGFVPVK